MIRAYETGLLAGHYPQKLVEWVGIEPTCLAATGLQPAALPLEHPLLKLGSQSKNRICEDRLSADYYTI